MIALDMRLGSQVAAISRMTEELKTLADEARKNRQRIDELERENEELRHGKELRETEEATARQIANDILKSWRY